MCSTILYKKVTVFSIKMHSKAKGGRQFSADFNENFCIHEKFCFMSQFGRELLKMT
jgi:hypothetical protein